MKLSAPKISRKSWTVLLTLALIAFTYVFYFFIYVETNERLYNKKAYRTLEKIADNIHDKNKNLTETETISKQVISDFEKGISKSEKRDRLKLRFQEIDSIQESLHDEIEKIEDPDSTKSQERKDSLKIEMRLLDIEYSKNINDYYEFGKSRQDLINQLNNRLKVYNLTAVVVDDKNSVDQKNNLDYAKFDIVMPNDKFEIKVVIAINDFINPLLREDVFDNFIIVRNEGRSIYQTFRNKLEVIGIDKILLDSSGVRSGNTKMFLVGETAYKAFVFSTKYRNNESWILVGCVEYSAYAKQIRQIDSWIILYAGLAVLLIIISMPLLKLFLMSEIERLYIRNVISTGLSIVVGASLMMLVFLILIYFYGHDKRNLDDNLRDLSTEVNLKFTQEMEDGYNQLTLYDSLLSNDLAAWKFMANDSSRSNILSNDIFKHTFYPYYNEMFWLDNLGLQKTQFTPFKKENPILDLSDRNYYKDVINNDMWSWHPDSKVAFESIVSWTTGYNEVALSKRSINPRYAVAVITTKLHSVIDPILPLGFGFAIINESGQVLIHSDKKKILQENFIEEINRNPNLRAAIYSHTITSTTADYAGKKHRMLITPIQKTSLYLVTYSNLEYLKTRIAVTWILALFLIVLSFLGVGLLVVMMLISRYKPSVLKISHFYFDWMKPSKKKHNLYRQLIVANIATVLLTILFNNLFPGNQIDVINRALITPMLVFVITYLYLDYADRKSYSVRFILMALSLFILVNLTSILFFQASFSIVFFQAAIVALFYFITKIQQFPTFIERIKHPYPLFLFAWLFSTSIVPTFYHYEFAYAQESEIWSKNTLLDFGQKILEKESSVNEQYLKLDTTKSINKQYLEAKTKQGSYPIFIDTLEVTYKSQNPWHFDSKNFNDILFEARPNLNDLMIRNKGLVYPVSADNLFTWNYGGTLITETDSFPKENFNRVGLQYLDYNQGATTLSMVIDKINFLSLNDFKSFYFMAFLVLVILLYALYQIIKYAVSKIYAKDEQLSEQRKEIQPDELTSVLDAGKNIILLGLANSGRTELLRNTFKKTNEIEFINCILISQTNKWEKIVKKLETKNPNIVILDNFEYEINNHKSNNKKLQLLEQLISTGNKIIISTEVHPMEISEFYYDEIKNSTDKKQKEAYQIDMEVWRHIFSNFIDMYKPLKDNLNESLVKNSDLDINPIARELRYGSFLEGIKEPLERRLQGKEHNNWEHMVLEIQDIAKSYYYAMWNTLSKKERYIIYDLAKDTFVNIKNKQVIVGLLKKGLLVIKQGEIEILNMSFTNFVLETVNEEEALEMEKEENTKGKWATVSKVLVMVIVSLVVLIAFGDPDFFVNVNSILIAIAGVASLLPTLSSLFLFSQKVKS